jgi:outer membrane protein, heavy metal efflux system
MLKFITTFVFIFMTFNSHAQRFTLESAANYARKHNTTLSAARHSIEEADSRLQHSGRLKNPEIQTGLRPNVKGREFLFDVEFSQKFPLTNRLKIEQSISQLEVKAAREEVKSAEQKLAITVKNTGLKLLVLEATKKLKAKQIANSKELATSAANIAKQAEGSVIDAEQLNLETQQLSLDLLELEIEKATLLGELAVLLGLRNLTSIEFVDELSATIIPDMRNRDIRARADYRAAEAKIEAAHLGVNLAKANKWDDATIGLGAEVARTEDAPNGLETDNIVGIRFSVPLPFWNKNDGKIKEAQATVKRSEKEAQALAEIMNSEALSATAEMKAARRMINQIDDVLLVKAQQIEDNIKSFYQQGQPTATLADVLRSREKRFSLEQSKINSLKNFHLARIRFEAAMGL